MKRKKLAAYVALPAPAPCLGFAIVARHRALGYTPVTNPTLAHGYRFEEVWIFGTPSRQEELDLWQVVAPILATMHQSNIHRIPN
jgi:hypothetical protein